MNKQAYHIPSGDALIHVEIYGEAHLPFLLLLHGNGEDLHCFDAQIEYFADRYRVAAIDSRAHGKSTRGTGSLDFHTLSEDILAVMEALKIKNAHFIGFSDGAILAIHLALKNPERINSMILIGANYTPRGFTRSAFLQTRAIYCALCACSLFSREVKQKKEIWQLMVKHPRLRLQDIARIAIPTCVITGENDVVSQRENDEIHHAIAGSKRLILPNADHFIPTNHHNTLNRIADEFLDSLAADNKTNTSQLCSNPQNKKPTDIRIIKD